MSTYYPESEAFRAVLNGVVQWQNVGSDLFYRAESLVLDTTGQNMDYDPMSEYYGYYPPVPDVDPSEVERAEKSWPACLFYAEARHSFPKP